MAASDLERGKRIGGGSHILVNRRPGPYRPDDDERQRYSRGPDHL